MPATFTFALTPDSLAATPTAAAPVVPVVLGQVSTAVKAGLRWPFTVGSSGNPNTATGDDLRETRVAFVMGTQATSTSGAGEIPMRMRLGSIVHLLLNTSFNDVRESLAVVYGQRALGNALPNEMVMSAEVESSDSGVVNVTLAVADRRTVGKDSLRRTMRKVPIKVTRK